MILRNIFISLMFAVLLQGCASFAVLPETIESSSIIEGVYLNDPILNPFGDRKLWPLLENTTQIMDDSSYISISFNEKGKLQAELIKQNIVIAKKEIKGKFHDDGCYYIRRDYSMIPFIPVFWGYSDHRIRIYSSKESIIVERTGSSGGGVIFMASGNQYKDAWEYKSVKIKKVDK